MPSRVLPVPDGLDGARVDAALAKMLGFSRTFAAEVAEAGGVRMDGRALGNPTACARLARGGVGGAARTGDRPGRRPGPRHRLRRRRHRRRRQALRRRRAPSVGWEGPTVLGALAAAGFRIATTGAAERQGVVHRLDVGTSGLMVVAKSSARTPRSSARSRSARSRRSTTRRAGAPRSARRNDRCAHRAPPSHSWKFAVTPDGKDSVTHYETLEAFPSASLLEIHLETGRTHQIRVHMAAHRHPCVGDPLYGADPTLSARRADPAVAARARALVRAPATTEWVTFTSDYPADLAHALDVLRAELRLMPADVRKGA
jgi:23S rRNA pseudouridine1911/1915/1917 synthase